MPDSSYVSEVAVVVNDGLLDSDPATAKILVEYQNAAPLVFIDQDQVNN